MRTILQPTVDGLRAEGMPFIGLLYAGLMLTKAGPKVLEFNCRFGDPETQVLLPLLDSDLLEILSACAAEELHTVDIRWKSGVAACVVAASKGYPGQILTGYEITGLTQTRPDSFVFHAGTRPCDEAHNDPAAVLTAGGRVLCATGWGADLRVALAAAYSALSTIQFEGMQYRKDIGWRAFNDQYTATGVSIDAGNRAVELMKDAVRSTYGPEVLMGIGAFGGLYDAAVLQSMRQPVLVSSTDGVGTKVKLAAQAGRYRGIGQDIVNHCINDILVQGARPLFFLDYFATSHLQPEIVAEVVAGIAEACRQAGCALIGGETAEMPGVYAVGEFDLAGTIIGAVERQSILPRSTDLQPGDVLLGLRSSGPHTNGYSLIRKVFEGVPLDKVFPELGISLADALLAPHRSYLNLLFEPISQINSIKALAHLTGGGFIENIPRVLPEGISAIIRIGSWQVPPLFHLIQQRGGIHDNEMYRVFNMGIGMLVIISPEHLAAVQSIIPEETWVIGRLVAGERRVVLE